MRERFSELLPWYVNGTLSEEDRQWMENYLREHPAAQAEVAWYRSLKEQINDNAPKVPATIGLAKTMQLIRGDQPTIAERITAFLGGFGLRPATSGRSGASASAFSLRPALALGLLAVVAIQAGVIATMMGTRGADEAALMRAGRTVPAEEGPLLKVNFAPDAREADIRLLLVSVQGTLAGGPGQLGDYFIRVPTGKEQAAATQLRGNAIVQSVEVVPGLPARP